MKNTIDEKDILIIGENGGKTGELRIFYYIEDGRTSKIPHAKVLRNKKGTYNEEALSILKDCKDREEGEILIDGISQEVALEISMQLVEEEAIEEKKTEKNISQSAIPETVRTKSDIYVTSEYGRPEIIYYDDSREVQTMSLLDEDGNIQRDSLEYIKTIDDSNQKYVKYGILDNTMRNIISTYIGHDIAPAGTLNEQQTSTVTVNDEKSSVDFIIMDIDEKTSLIRYDYDSKGEADVAIIPLFSEEGFYNVDALTVLLDNYDNKTTKEIIYDGPKEILEELEKTVKNADGNPYYKEFDNSKIKTITIDSTSEIFPAGIIIETEKGNQIHMPLVVNEDKDGSVVWDEDALMYLEGFMAEKNMSYEELKQHDFINVVTQPTLEKPSTTQKQITRIVTYDFKENYNPVDPSLPVKPNSLMVRTNKRELTQACIFYNDGSFKNVLLEQRETPSNGIKQVYRYEDNILDDIEAFTGKKMSVQEAQLQGFIEKVSGREFENNFFQYMAKSATKKNELMVIETTSSTEEKLQDYLYKYERKRKQDENSLSKKKKLRVISRENTPILKKKKEQSSSKKLEIKVPPRSAVPILKKQNQSSTVIPPEEKNNLWSKIVNTTQEKLSNTISKLAIAKQDVKDWIKVHNVTRQSKKGRITYYQRENPFTLICESKVGTITKKYGEKLWNYTKEHKAKTVAGVMLTALGIGVVCSYNSPEEEMKNTISKVTEDDNMLNSGIDYTSMSIGEILETIPNKTIRMIQNAKWDYINYYNKTLADANIEEGKTSKLAITYDGITSQYIGYNADFLTKDNINQLYGNYKITSEEILNEWLVANNEDMLAYVSSTEEIDKSALFMTEEGQYFHHKYASLILDMANAETNDIKVASSDKFRQILINDVKEMQEEQSKNGTIASYKTSILPIIDAAEFICQRDELEPILNEDTWKVIKGDLTMQAYDYFDKTTTDLKDYQVAVEGLEEINNNQAYGVLKEKVEEELLAEGYYNIDDRDIMNHSKFEIKLEENVKSR